MDSGLDKALPWLMWPFSWLEADTGQVDEETLISLSG